MRPLVFALLLASSTTLAAPPPEGEPMPPSTDKVGRASKSPKLAPGSKKPAGKPKTQAEIAEQRNWDGTQLYAKKKYAEATPAFREAVARVPEGRYFYNLCASLYHEGKFSDALTACEAVSKTEPTTQLQKMADELIGWIKDEARSQKIELRP